MPTVEQSGKLFFVLFLGAIAGALAGAAWLIMVALGSVAKGAIR
jgi:hypothetical protein